MIWNYSDISMCFSSDKGLKPDFNSLYATQRPICDRERAVLPKRSVALSLTSLAVKVTQN